MISLRTVAWACVGAAIAIGTWQDFRPRRSPVYAGSYRVLTADFHLHPFPLSAGTIAPWDLIWEAQHQGLDVVAISGHNQVWSGLVARWVSRHIGGPIVLAAEEIHGPHFHMVAAGIHSTISWRLTAAEAIAEVHLQDGVAIAAHPTASAWPAYDEPAMRQLDGAEVLQPAAFESAQFASDMRTFFRRKPLAAIGSSDWHGPGPPGICRTLVFVHADTEAEILQAIRERRTVVAGEGEYFGDPALIALAKTIPGESGEQSPASGILGVLGLAGIALAAARESYATPGIRKR